MELSTILSEKKACDLAMRPKDCSLSMVRLKSLAIKSEIDFE